MLPIWPAAPDAVAPAEPWKMVGITLAAEGKQSGIFIQSWSQMAMGAHDGALPFSSKIGLCQKNQKAQPESKVWE